MKVVYILSDIDKALAFEWIAERLDKRKFDLSFILILQHPSQLEQFLTEEGISCISFYYKSKKDLPKVFVRVYSELKKQRPAIVHCHLLYGSLIGLTAAKLAGIKKRIYTRHHSDFHHRYFPKGIKWDKWCNHLATGIVAPSGAVREVLLQFEKVPDKKIAVIHHGFDLAYFAEPFQDRIAALRIKYGVEGKYPVIGVISRFTVLKGIQYIIPAFRQVLETYPDALLMFFGAQGDYEKELKTMLGEIPAKNYCIVAFENDLSSVYHLFDAFVQVSIDRTIEAFGQTYVEALAAGIPSVFTLSGIANDFIRDGENALVVPYKDADAIFRALSQLVSNLPLRNKLSLNGKKIVKEQFELQTMVQKLEQLYESV
ncbi:MAG TPA: glycosyltransferase family 4 protein [Chitinophagaceae bacterium]|nr:glycosyltransferase family 4 protein [Chitinophagaceae bacterium]